MRYKRGKLVENIYSILKLNLMGLLLIQGALSFLGGLFVGVWNILAGYGVCPVWKGQPPDIGISLVCLGVLFLLLEGWSPQTKKETP
jgi:hypothetical protein